MKPTRCSPSRPPREAAPPRIAARRRGKGTSETRAEDEAGTSWKADALDRPGRSPAGTLSLSARPPIGSTPAGLSLYEPAAAKPEPAPAFPIGLTAVGRPPWPTRQTTYSVAQERGLSYSSLSTSRPERCSAHGDAGTLDVGEGDIGGILDALQPGADPEKVDACQANDPRIRDLLIYARRRNKLYPSRWPSYTETALDRALRNGLEPANRQKANDLLSKETNGVWPGDPTVWRDALRERRTDIQRAILLLAADRDPFFRILQDRAPTDKGVAQVMKEIPYCSPKRGMPQNFNGTYFARPWVESNRILCRHLVEHRHSVQERDESLKFDDRQFASWQAINENVSRVETERNYHRVLFGAAEAHLFRNDDLGKVLVEQLKRMEAQGESGRLMVLVSAFHAMSVELRIKKKEGKQSYVVRIYDPNQTTSHARAASDGLRAFERMRLMDFFTDVQYSMCFPRWDEPSLVFVRPKADGGRTLVETAPAAPENRMLTRHIADEKMGAWEILYLMSYGFAGDLRRLKKELARRGEEELIRSLLARHGDVRGVSQALWRGHSDVVRAFFELVELVPADKRVEVLRNSGLFLALKEGHVDTAKVFVRGVFELMPSRMRAGLVGEALYRALDEGHADAIRRFGEVLEVVPEEMRAEMAAARGSDGRPWLAVTLALGGAEAVKAYGELLKRVPQESHAELIAARQLDGCPSFIVALKLSRTNVLKAFGELVSLLPAKERAALLADAKPWLSTALWVADRSTREAFRELRRAMAPRWSFPKFKLC